MTPKIYIHTPSGKEYLVLSEVTDATPERFGGVMVLYTPYTKSPNHEFWYVMDMDQFLRVFKEKDNG